MSGSRPSEPFNCSSPRADRRPGGAPLALTNRARHQGRPHRSPSAKIGEARFAAPACPPPGARPSSVKARGVPNRPTGRLHTGSPGVCVVRLRSFPSGADRRAGRRDRQPQASSGILRCDIRSSPSCWLGLRCPGEAGHSPTHLTGPRVRRASSKVASMGRLMLLIAAQHNF